MDLFFGFNLNYTLHVIQGVTPLSGEDQIVPLLPFTGNSCTEFGCSYFQTPSWVSAAIAVVILAEKFLQCQIHICFESGPSGMKTTSDKMLSFMQII